MMSLNFGKKKPQLNAWTNDANEIVERLYLGGLGAAESPIFIAENKITHIVSCVPANDARSECDDNYRGKHQSVRYLQLKLEDVDEEEISRFFKPAYSFISEVLSGEGSVLIHCQAGISRSATIVASYLMKEKGITHEAALELIKAKRAKASPNGGFLRQLRAYEKEIANQ